MAYTEHNFTSGSVLYADDLNTMDEAIAKMHPYVETAELTISKISSGAQENKIIRFTANNLTPGKNYVIKVVRNARTHGHNSWFVQNDNYYGYAQIHENCLDWMYNSGYLKSEFPFSTSSTTYTFTLDAAKWLTDLCIPYKGSSDAYHLMGTHGRKDRALKFTFYLYEADEMELIAKADTIISAKLSNDSSLIVDNCIKELQIKLLKIK